MWANPQGTADLVTFTEENFNGKLHFLCGDSTSELNISFLFRFNFALTLIAKTIGIQFF